MTARRPLAAAAALAAVLATGCGGSDGADRPTAAKAEATATPAEGATGARVAIRGFEYRPAKVSVAAGQSVTWVDRDTANHTVTFDEGKRQTGVPNLRNGQRKAVRFDRPGTYAYVCAYHPNMHGTVVVG